MRTTLDIDSEVLEAAKSIPDEHTLPVGTVLSDLAKRGLRQRTTVVQERKGLRVLGVSRDATVLTLECVKRVEGEP